MKMKSESEVAQSYPTLSDSMEEISIPLAHFLYLIKSFDFETFNQKSEPTVV